MKSMVLPSMKMNVTNDSTRYFILKSCEGYDKYLRRMQECVGERFYYILEDDEYMEDILKAVIGNSKIGFNKFLKRHRYKGSLNDVHFDEVLVNLREIHNAVSFCILNDHQ
ncbi:hypothetical protein [Pectobacterium carotovorum]|uniref:hypothetical protein n=1 Tax=Pectobacterium carotovorum TaxID=554 RepID=UPI000582531E|nr:hypothetical protein [Pectobacterium carotovorum]KHS78729.1 hypothetical protein RC84_19705 [Pectobacterium carotovorum subsp. carotovorum]